MQATDEDIYFVRLFSDQTFDQLHSITLDPYETGVSILSCSFADDPTPYIVLGTGYAIPEEPEPTKVCIPRPRCSGKAEPRLALRLCALAMPSGPEPRWHSFPTVRSAVPCGARAAECHPDDGGGRGKASAIRWALSSEDHLPGEERKYQWRADPALHWYLRLQGQGR